MISVERIVEYAELPSEPPMESDKKDALPKEWPQSGSIEFKSLSLRYAENAYRILKDLTFRIDAKVRTGVDLFTLFKKLHNEILFVCFKFVAKNWHLWTYWCGEKFNSSGNIPIGRK